MTQTNLFEEKYRQAQRQAKHRIELGEKEQLVLLETVAKTVIRDRLVPPASMEFLDHEDTGGSRVDVVYAKDPTRYAIHPHALTQLAQKVQIPLTYVRLLQGVAWQQELLAHNLNELFHKTQFLKNGETTRFLHRLVGNELRGFLSRRYNRQLATAPMLRAFIESARKAGGQPVEGRASDVRVSLKYFLPEVFEAYPGQYLCVGVEFTNSDFGAGKLAICQSVWDPLRDTRSVLDETISRVHLGSIIEDSDIEMSEETAAKEMEAQAGAIQDAVTQQLSKSAVDRLLKAVKFANEEHISWNQMKGQLSRFLHKKELQELETLRDNCDIVDLPPIGRGLSGEPLATRWWVTSALSHLANKSTDVDRVLELQHEAGKILAQGKGE